MQLKFSFWFLSRTSLVSQLAAVHQQARRSIDEARAAKEAELDSVRERLAKMQEDKSRSGCERVFELDSNSLITQVISHRIL